MKKRSFSLIEMLTVIVVILILMTLAVPSMNSIRKKARTVLCANNLKQLGVLMASYADEHDGYLPYSNSHTYQNPGRLSYLDSRGKGKLYGQWAGHLIPYLNVDLPSWNRGGYYFDKAKMKYKTIEFHDDTGDIYKSAGAKLDEDYYNWKLLNDMYYKGGYGSLQIFICPESTLTFFGEHLDTERFIPRISGILPVRYNSLRGLPSSYAANGELFGAGKLNSRRLEDVNRTNYLLLEGVSNGNLCTPVGYQKFFSLANFYGGHVNSVVSAYGYVNAGNPPLRSTMASFMHDDTTEIWLSAVFNSNMGKPVALADVNLYNKAFNPVAAASFVWDRPEVRPSSLASNQYPGENWELYETPATKGKFKILRYYGEDVLPGYMYGNMNVLGADLSVSNMHLGEMFENARTLGVDSQ